MRVSKKHDVRSHEIMDAIIMRIVNADTAAAKIIADNPDLPSIPKLLQILSSCKPKKGNGKREND